MKGSPILWLAIFLSFFQEENRGVNSGAGVTKIIQGHHESDSNS